MLFVLLWMKIEINKDMPKKILEKYINIRENEDILDSLCYHNKNDVKLGKVINEGVKYVETNDSFIFDFINDNEQDIIKLNKVGFKVNAFNQCFYYGYQFEENIESNKRTSFINSIKFPDGRISDNDKKIFITNAVNQLDNDINLPSYEVVIFPESISELNRDMLKYLNRFSFPKLIKIELIKELPQNIDFDYERFENEVLNAKLPNGRDRYTSKQKEDVLNNIRELIDSIHKLDYFSIARNVKKSKYRQYIKNFYKFKNETDKKIFEAIQNTNVLVIDDIVTSGTTISYILKCLRSVNNTNNIVVFSLIGKEI